MNEPQKIHVPAGGELEVLTGSGLPQSDDCEHALLGCVLLERTPAAWALSLSLGVRPNAFANADNRAIWTAINALRSRGVTDLDAAIVLEELKSTGKLDPQEARKKLVEVMRAGGLGAQTKFYAEQLVLIWQRRQMIVEGARMREIAINFEDRKSFTEGASEIGSRLIRLGRRGNTRSQLEELNAVEVDVQTSAEGKVDQSRWISSGLRAFDEKCKPFTGGREDQLVVIGGGSGVGKSVVLRQLGGTALEQGKMVLSFSRETSMAGFLEMMIASWTDFDLLNPDLFRSRLPAFRAKCEEVRQKWCDKQLFFVEHTPETPLLTVEDIEDHVRVFVNLRGQPDLILIDYLQLFGTRKRYGSREETVATVSHKLQALIRELPGCTMIVAAQLNESGLDEMRQVNRERGSNGKEGKFIPRLPKPGDIRESQAIYHDADRMIFLYRPPIDCRGMDQSNPNTLKPEVWWFQEKRRRGGTGIVHCWFEKRFTRFVEFGAKEAEAAEAADRTAGGFVPPGGMPKDDWRKAKGR